VTAAQPHEPTESAAARPPGRSILTSRSHRRTAALIATSALAVSCATTAPAPPPSRAQSGVPPAQSSGDDVLANSVYEALDADPVYFYRHVNVRVHGGVAELSGYVWSTDAIYRAREIARTVPGVRRVVTSHLELEREGHADGVTR
jgi:osmotically-inducible protein OsmY